MRNWNSRIPAAKAALTLALAVVLPAVPRAAASAPKPADFMTVGGVPTGVLGGESISAIQAIANVSVCGAPNDQFPPVLISDGNGGAIAVWSDYRGGDLDVYAQKLDEGNTPVWPADGVPVCKAAGNQMNPRAVSDGAGGVIVVWQDDRNGAADIYAQRVASTGTTQWASGGVPVCAAANAQRNPTVVESGLGGAVVAWVDERGADADVYAQRLSAAGAPQWAVDGVALCTAGGTQEGLQAVADQAGGAILAWRDDRGGAAQSDIYAQRVTAAGGVSWTANGVAACAATGAQDSPAAIGDGAGGVIVTWRDSRGASPDVYVQRLSGAGAAQWTANGALICGAAGTQQLPRLCTDGANGAMVVWEDRRGAAADVYAQRVDGAGAPQWAGDGVGVCTATADQLTPAIAVDPTGGAMVAWSDARTPANDQDIFVQRLLLNGTSSWTANGVLICDTAGKQELPAVVRDGLDGAIAVWSDFRGGVNSDLYSQRVQPNGQVASQCASTIVLSENSPVVTPTGSGLNFYTFLQEEFYWAGVAVRPSSGTDWDIEVYEPETFGIGPYPVCFNNAYAGSYGSAGVDYVVGNFNPGRTPLANYGVRVLRYSGASTGTVEWDDDFNLISKDCTSQCGGTSGNNWTGPIDVWDLFLVAGQTYTFDFTKTGTADIKLALFRSPGTTGSFFAPRSSREFETANRYTVYQAPATSWYGVVLINENGLTGTYNTKVTTGVPVGVGDPPAGATGIRGVAPNPARGEALIQFALAAAGDVSFQVIDMAGRQVGTVPGRQWDAGSWSVRWDGRAEDGRALSAGVYFVQMKVDGRTVGRSRVALIR